VKPPLKVRINQEIILFVDTDMNSRLECFIHGIFYLSLDATPEEESPDAQSLLYKPARAQVTWPSGRNRSVHVLHMAFVETSFLNISLMSICFAGMMVNFVTGLGWGLSVKWLRLGVAGKWAPLTIVQTRYIFLETAIFLS
jgi:hypothetical protein